MAQYIVIERQVLVNGVWTSEFRGPKYPYVFKLWSGEGFNEARRTMEDLWRLGERGMAQLTTRITGRLDDGTLDFGRDVGQTGSRIIAVGYIEMSNKEAIKRFHEDRDEFGFPAVAGLSVRATHRSMAR